MSEEIRTVLICKPLAFPGYIVPGSIVFECSGCHKLISVAPSSLDIIRGNPGIRVVCWLCGAKLMKEHPGPIELPTPAQLEEIRQAQEQRRN
jgi:hypothetical protein